MKIATFNINNINKRLANLLAWLRTAAPDVVCLQELKSTDAEFPIGAIRRAGYDAIWRGQKTWNGVAILARDRKLVPTRSELPGDPTDIQSRYIEAAVNGIIIGCLYAPNGNPQPGPKFDYKLAWLERLIRHASSLRKAGVPVVLAGDYNVVPTPADIYQTHSYDKDALVQPQSRALFRRLLTLGWTDAIRAQHPDDRIYTYWDYMRNRWARDAGLRLDHLLLSPDVAKRLLSSGIDRGVRGEPNASDHAPAWIELREAATRTPRRTTGSSRTASRAAPARKAAHKAARRSSGRPLLVVDGDSFAHRSYHALPKTIRRDRNRPAGAILGFANMLLRLYQAEAPRAVLVAWDTLEEPTYRHEAFADYQSGREFDDELIEQLDVIPQFVAACGFANAKGAGYEADDFLSAAAARGKARRHGAGGERRPRHLPARVRADHDPLSGAGRRAGAHRAARGARALRRRARAGARLHRHPGRSVRQAAGPAGRGRDRRRDAAAPLRLDRRAARCRPVRGAGRAAAVVSRDRDHEPEGAAAAPARPDADLDRGRGAGAQMAAAQARGTAGHARRRR